MGLFLSLIGGGLRSVYFALTAGEACIYAEEDLCERVHLQKGAAAIVHGAVHAVDGMQLVEALVCRARSS